MFLLTLLLLTGTVMAYRTGRRHQGFVQARSDVSDSRGKFFRAWRAQWTAGATAVTAWLLLGLCLVLAAAVANR